MLTLLKNSVQLMSAIVILLTLISYICPHINPAIFPWISFVGTAFPWILLLNVFFVLLWAWHRSRFAFYHIGMILFGWQYVAGFIGFDFGKDTVPEKAITVATHNLGGLFRGQKRSEALYEKTASAYSRFLQENGFPDLLCTQETGGKFYPILAQKMGYPYTFNLKKGTVILSRYPIEGGGDIPFGATANSSLWADIRIGKQLVRVYNVHLQSNKVTSTTEKVIEGGELDEGETWHDIGIVLGQVGRATGVRAEQAQRLREHINKCPHPVILCGDFNDTPNSYVYTLLSEGFTDTFTEKALGMGTSFAGVLPFLRIDYILTDPAFKVYSCKTVHGKFSDHFPVFVSLGGGP
jgi:endonuclease/exonuclease/phosphatase family metal-dependent hydrolase